ncbi:unnamed protein product [Allacma fusca]|uniref:Uncharacterized protein n=1 Tax=Allacma fusca TaxID=39272 RepID=A0A8J2KYA4_9HEXA|nr:unnamed protein product [Allacma fusca]
MIYTRNRLKDNIQAYRMWSEIQIEINLKFGNQDISVIGIYAPEEGKEEESDEFYDTRQDRKRNEDILKELGAEPIIRRVKDYRKKWRKHVDRMPDERSPQKVKEYTPTGRRSRGRPKKRLDDTSASNSSTFSQMG